MSYTTDVLNSNTSMRESHMRYSLPFLRRERRYPLLDIQSAKTRPRLQSPKLDVEAKDDSEEPPVVQETPRVKEVPFDLSQESQYSFPLIADTAESTSIAALPND